MCLTCVTTAGDFDTSAVELGILDFGNSINFRLVGDATWAADFKSWHAAADGAPVVPVDPPVDPDNTAPVAGDDADAFTVAQGESVVISVADLLANDTDADGDALVITAVDNLGTDDGTAVLAADGLSITFTAAAGYEGAASFAYTVSDGVATDTATVTGAVTAEAGPEENIIDLSAGDAAGTVGVVDVFQYELDSSSGRAVGKDGEVTITGFTAGEDRLEFVDVEAGTLTDANFTTFPGVSLAENPFADNTSIAFDPDAGVSNIIIIAGIQDVALDTIDFAVV